MLPSHTYFLLVSLELTTGETRMAMYFRPQQLMRRVSFQRPTRIAQRTGASVMLQTLYLLMGLMNHLQK